MLNLSQRQINIYNRLTPLIRLINLILMYSLRNNVAGIAVDTTNPPQSTTQSSQQSSATTSPTDNSSQRYDTSSVTESDSVVHPVFLLLIVLVVIFLLIVMASILVIVKIWFYRRKQAKPQKHWIMQQNMLHTKAQMSHLLTDEPYESVTTSQESSKSNKTSTFDVP